MNLVGSCWKKLGCEGDVPVLPLSFVRAWHASRVRHSESPRARRMAGRCFRNFELQKIHVAFSTGSRISFD